MKRIILILLLMGVWVGRASAEQGYDCIHRDSDGFCAEEISVKKRSEIRSEADDYCSERKSLSLRDCSDFYVFKKERALFK